MQHGLRQEALLQLSLRTSGFHFSSVVSEVSDVVNAGPADSATSQAEGAR